MSKKNFVTLILSAIGGILFALGMCMTLLPEWNAWGPGVVTGCTGMVVLLVMLLIRRKMAGKPVLVKLTAKTVAVQILHTVRPSAVQIHPAADSAVADPGSAALVHCSAPEKMRSLPES